MTRNIQEAAAAISVALSKKQNNIEALWINARVKYHTVIDAGDAMESIKAVLKYESDHAGALELKKKIERQKVLRQKGNEAFKDKNFSEALKLYSEALLDDDKKVPVSFTAVIFLNRATAHKQLGDFDNAIADLTSAIDRNSTYVKAYIRRAQCYSELEMWDESIKDYSTALSYEPFNNIFVGMLQAAQHKLQEQKSRSYYEVMGLPPFASPAEVRKAYRLLALRYHPDKVANTGISPLKAEKLFKEIQYCNEILSEPQKKQQYDIELQRTSMVAQHFNHTNPYASQQPYSYPYSQFHQQNHTQSQNNYSSNPW
eukprot:TRINITY_DN2179_c0_g2_i1.p1 TRINITY_DN2179_c0_g2~~TRINITY_DN2179_c0_g2_i1.p1  ORF type:complete len:346 (-),score=69.41 TRINITY_DN2179_c0_g2_i1:260-1201(-)